jgi:hypothetical protein
VEYIRFRSVYPGIKGQRVGVFGLVNVLGRHGMLAPEEEQFRRENNAWYNAAYLMGRRTIRISCGPFHRPTMTVVR